MTAGRLLRSLAATGVFALPRRWHEFTQARTVWEPNWWDRCLRESCAECYDPQSMLLRGLSLAVQRLKADRIMVCGMFSSTRVPCMSDYAKYRVVWVSRSTLPPFTSILAIQVLELCRCSIADGDMTVLCKGLADARCRIRLLLLSNNVDLRDRGATGRPKISDILRFASNSVVRR